MIRSLIVGALCSVALLSSTAPGEPAEPQARPGAEPAAAAPKADQERAAPEFDVPYLADRTGAGGPQAVVRTDARSEEQWMAIGRELRARRPSFPVMVVFFISEHAGPIPEGYPDCPPDQRQAFERWTLGSYVYQARHFEHNATGDTVELVKRNVVTPRDRTMNGVEVIELHATDPTEIRNAPAAQRIAGVVVVVPGLGDDDLTRVARAYEDEYGTPRLLQIVFFREQPEWPDDPFMTQGFYNHAGRAYLRSSRAKDADRTEILPLAPRWATLEDGQIVEK